MKDSLEKRNIRKRQNANIHKKQSLKGVNKNIKRNTNQIKILVDSIEIEDLIDRPGKCF